MKIPSLQHFVGILRVKRRFSLVLSSIFFIITPLLFAHFISFKGAVLSNICLFVCTQFFVFIPVAFPPRRKEKWGVVILPPEGRSCDWQTGVHLTGSSKTQSVPAER